MAEQAAQLVLGGDHRAGLAGARQRGQDGRRAQPLGVVHHHFGAGRDIEQVVAADAVHRGRHAGDDGQVVRVGEARHNAVSDQRAAQVQGSRHPGHHACGHRLGDVVGFAAIDADHDGGLGGQSIASLVDDQRLGLRHVGSFGSPARRPVQVQSRIGRPACWQVSRQADCARFAPCFRAHGCATPALPPRRHPRRSP